MWKERLGAVNATTDSLSHTSKRNLLEFHLLRQRSSQLGTKTIYQRLPYSTANKRTMSRLATHLRTGAMIAVGTQIGVTMASMGYASGRFGGANAKLLLRPDGRGPREETSDARHFKLITQLVTSMYSGQGIKPHDHVQLADEIEFADPVAICRGPAEVKEAFGALRFLQPEPIRSPRCIHVEPKGASIFVTYSLYQRYLRGWLEFPSLLVLDVQLKQRSDMPQSDFLILRMEEQWNGVPLLTTFLNKAARRFNGVLSHQLTRLLPPQK